MITFNNINKMYITFFGIGYIPIASGTFGSMAGIILGYIIYLIEFNLFYILIPILFILGILMKNI